MKIIKKTLKWIVVAFVASTILSVVALRFVPVYFTPLMFMRCFEQVGDGKDLKLKHHWVPLDKISPSLPMAVMASEDAKFLGGTPGEVDDTAANEGSAVGDAHNDFTTVGGVLHAQHRAEGVGAVCTGEAVVVQPFAVGGAGSRCTLGIIGGLAFLHNLCRKK